jgi:hypothetical protein
MAKQFRITEKLHVRFESSFTNVLNHTNFASPVTAIDSSTLGALMVHRPQRTRVTVPDRQPSEWIF